MTQETETGATLPEVFAWLIFGLAGGVWAIAFITAMNTYGDETPTLWMMGAGGLAAVALPPALILSGIRQLLPRLRAGAVHHADTATDDAHDGRRDAAGGEHLRGDVREPDTRDA